MICAGIDAGSRAIKVAIFDHGQNRVAGFGILDQGVDQSRLAEELYDRTLGENGLRRTEVSAVVATGYGRSRIHFADACITEITCHARGAHHGMPEARTIIEIGGQDSKVICLGAAGRVRDFMMNDRCAAGTGRFLEMVAARMNVKLGQLGALTRESHSPAMISNTCAVFAETEIVGLLADGKIPADIAAGVQSAIASRVASMAGPAIQGPLCFTGGVALQEGMAGALEAAIGQPVQVLPNPQFSGALGAALLAAEPR